MLYYFSKYPHEEEPMRRAYSVWSVLTAIGAAGCAVVMIGQIFSLKRGGPTDHCAGSLGADDGAGVLSDLVGISRPPAAVAGCPAGGGSLFNPGALSGLRQWRLQQLSGPLG